MGGWCAVVCPCLCPCPCACLRRGPVVAWRLMTRGVVGALGVGSAGRRGAGSETETMCHGVAGDLEAVDRVKGPAVREAWLAATLAVSPGTGTLSSIRGTRTPQPTLDSYSLRDISLQNPSPPPQAKQAQRFVKYMLVARPTAAATASSPAGAPRVPSTSRPPPSTWRSRPRNAPAAPAGAGSPPPAAGPWSARNPTWPPQPGRMVRPGHRPCGGGAP